MLAQPGDHEPPNVGFTNPEHPIPDRDYEVWEQQAIRAYMDRHHIGEES